MTKQLQPLMLANAKARDRLQGIAKHMILTNV